MKDHKLAELKRSVQNATEATQVSSFVVDF